MDNFFTFLELLCELRKRNLGLIETVRKNRRELPRKFTQVPLVAGSTVSSMNMHRQCIMHLRRIEPSRMWRRTGCVWEHHGKEENWIVYSSNAVNKRSEKMMSPVYLQQDSTVLRDVHQTIVHSVCHLHVCRLLNFLTGLILVVSSGLPHLNRAPFAR